MILKGKFISLRSISKEDAAITLKWRKSEKAKLLNKGSQTIEEQEKWIEHKINSKNDYDFIIEYLGEPIGACAIANIDWNNKFAEYGRLIIGEECPIFVFYETTDLILKFAYDHLKLHRVHGHILELNTSIHNVWKKLGWTTEGVLRESQLIEGKFYSCIMMSLLEEEYRNIFLPKLSKILRMF